jgi:tetratricopeptide (TPR) repeat protein
MSDYNKAIALNPQNREAYNNRGLQEYKIGRYKDAIADYDMAISMKQNDMIAYQNRALCKEAVGDTDGAAKDYAKYHELKGDK